MSKSTNILLLILAVVVLYACDEQYTPKPPGYFRIDLPEHEYTLFDSTFPYTFEYPVYAVLSPDPYAPEEPYWINVEFPAFKGRLHLSYKKVNGNLVEYLEDSRQFVMKHIPKASAINDSLLLDRNKKIYGLIYYIEGMGAASPCQFFLTDSADHFVRGALYFDVVPNNDSLAPVIGFLEEDIRHMLSTFEWKLAD
ncbi:MAG: gliding motility lipoprotein GldD [Bacteroidales bacterium]|nr:gliding motility lipoprotein GldD [Bacteroidales bacterium]